MGAIDIMILVIFVGAIAFGLWKGFLVQLGAVVGIVVGILLCRFFGSWLTGVLAGGSANANELYISGVFANVILFLVGFVGTILLAKVLKVATGALKLSAIDRIAGAVFTLFEWFFIFSLLLNIAQAITPRTDFAATAKMAGGRPARVVMDFAPLVLDNATSGTLFD